jgi:hypothetical protein
MFKICLNLFREICLCYLYIFLLTYSVQESSSTHTIFLTYFIFLFHVSILVKKDTLGRTHFENTLLEAYKQYLNKLEQMTTVLKKEKKTIKTQRNHQLAEIAVKCLCKILVAHSYFNYNMNIGQLLVCLLNNNNITVRQSVFNCFITLFKTDKVYSWKRLFRAQ